MHYLWCLCDFFRQFIFYKQATTVHCRYCIYKLAQHLELEMTTLPQEEMNKAMTEVRLKLIDLSGKRKVAKTQLVTARTEYLRTKLTYEGLRDVDSTFSTYEALGHMFVKSDITKIKTALEKQEKEQAEKVKNLENTEEKLDRAYEDQEKSFRELAEQWKTRETTAS